ncbi:hypothetical protein [Lichenifustis flavocetrariae]|uniref:Uncharacterized protein n=1 Tax=Lichenifustis flavocetrariae TaxID=2949735 RepID=A0AA42CQZ2_9HYPH|nr:hypothetical protein [Lichenifustis flavocetrariae]MCW6511927.1 hypothetical protein [Lichenifustis flavocetrariae]
MPGDDVLEDTAFCRRKPEESRNDFGRRHEGIVCLRNEDRRGGLAVGRHAAAPQRQDVQGALTTIIARHGNFKPLAPERVLTR